MGEPTISLTFSADMQRINAKPGDVFIVKIDGNLSQQEAERFKEYTRRAVGDYPVLVCTRGVTIEVALMSELKAEHVAS